MGKKVIASLAGSYRGQSLAGKDSRSSVTEQHPWLFSVHPAAAQMHGLGMPGCLLGMNDPEAQSGQRRTEGRRKRWETAWGWLAEDGHTAAFRARVQADHSTLAKINGRSCPCPCFYYTHADTSPALAISLGVLLDPASPVGPPVCTHLVKDETNARSSRDS